MQKIRLNIVALVRSEVHPNSYVIILKEEEGLRRLPILIGAFEAQAIVMALEQKDTNRPLTHDLFKHTLTHFHIDLKEIIISELKDGIFFATLFCINDNGTVLGIDARTSDAIALAVRFDCPIFVNPAILSEAGISIDENGEMDEELTSEDLKPLVEYELQELEQLLNEALVNEDYELAAKIRDEIKMRSNN